MASDAGPVEDLARVEVVAFTIFGIVGIALGLMASRALLKLVGEGNVLDAVMAASASDTRRGPVGKARIGIDESFVSLVIEQDDPAPAVGIKPDGYSSGLCLGQLIAAGRGERRGRKGRARGERQSIKHNDTDLHLHQVALPRRAVGRAEGIRPQKNEEPVFACAHLRGILR